MMVIQSLVRNLFFFNDTATTEIYTLSLHDALPISGRARRISQLDRALHLHHAHGFVRPRHVHGDRKSTRLNSSHSQISYAVFCLKKKKRTRKRVLDSHSKIQAVCDQSSVSTSEHIA